MDTKSKGLEALEELTMWATNSYMAMKEDDEKRLVPIIEKELKRIDVLEIMYFNCIIESAKQKKILEIIKTKEINVHALLLHLKRFDSPEGYNALVGEKYKITQEEYDLLKEVFKE